MKGRIKNSKATDSVDARAPSGRLFSRFETKLALLILLLVVPAFGLTLYTSFQQRRIGKERARESTLAIARLAAANQQQFIRNAKQLLATVGNLSFLTLTTNAAFGETHFRNLIKLCPDYFTFGLVELDGTVYCSASPADTAMSLADRSYFQRVVATKDFSIGEFQVGRLTGERSLNFGYPVFDANGELRRVIFAALRLSLLSDAIGRIPIPMESSISVYDRNGTVLARYPEPEKWVGKSVRATPLGQWILHEHNGVMVLPGVDNVSRLFAVTPVGDGQSPSLFVSVGIPLSASFAQANQELVRNCTILGVLTITLLAVAWLYARQCFLRPIGVLVAAADRIADGDLTTRTNLSQGAHQLCTLGAAFDGMAAMLEQRQSDIKRAHDTIAEANAQLEERVAARTAELRALNLELEAFSYSVSHDLRAPLRHIAGFVEMLREKGKALLDEKCMRYVGIIAKSAQNMGCLIDDLLSFSRTGQAEMCARPCDLSELAREAVKELETETAGRDINWKIPALPAVQADSALMRQVMLNLLSNAVKYSRGRPNATIEVGCEPHENGEFIFFVRDNGVGFDMQYADKLFGVFQRLHDTGEFEGTGIGLAIVKRIVARHGGRTWAESMADKGATFYFSMPKTPTLKG